MRFSPMFISLIFLLGTACAKKSSEETTVKIQLDPSIFTGSGNVSAANHDGSTDSGPEWGLNDPTSLADINCWGVFVGGPESRLQQSSCTMEGGSQIRFGTRAGFFPINEEGRVAVPTGPDRVFYLAGMASKDGQCERGFAVNPDINFDNYSVPFILGKSGRQSIEGPDKSVYIPIQDSFSDANKLKDCDFVSGEDPLKIVPYASNRSIWVQNNSVPRTVEIEHKGVSLDCKVSDGGGNLVDCPNYTQNRLIWQVADYTYDHIIQVTYGDGTVYREVFNPSLHYPMAITFVTCSTTHTTDTNFSDASFGTRLNTSGTVLCINPGVKITEDPGMQSNYFTHNVNNATLISQQTVDGSKASFIRNSDNPTFAITGSNNKYVGINFRSQASVAWTVALNNAGGNRFEDCGFANDSTGSTGPVLSVMSSGALANNTFVNSYITSQGTGDAVAAGTNARLSFDRSLIKSVGSAVHAIASSASILNITNSTLFADGTTASHPLRVEAPSTVNVLNSMILDGSGDGVRAVGGAAGGIDAVLNLNNTYFVRMDIGGSSGPAINTTIPSLGGILLNSATPNTFCSLNPSSRNFTAIQAGGLSGGSTWTTANQLFSDGSISASDCHNYPVVVEGLEKLGLW